MIMQMRDKPRYIANLGHYSGIKNIMNDNNVRAKRLYLQAHRSCSLCIRPSMFICPIDLLDVERGLIIRDAAREDAQGSATHVKHRQHDFQIAFHAPLRANRFTQHKETHRR